MAAATIATAEPTRREEEAVADSASVPHPVVNGAPESQHVRYVDSTFATSISWKSSTITHAPCHGTSCTATWILQPVSTNSNDQMDWFCGQRLLLENTARTPKVTGYNVAFVDSVPWEL
jgi:hypothetical protein